MKGLFILSIFISQSFGQECSPPLPAGEEAPRLPAGDGQRGAAHGAEAHGRLDHVQRAQVHHGQAGGRRTQEVHRRPQDHGKVNEVNVKDKHFPPFFNLLRC